MTDTQEFLTSLLIGGILGMVGQLIRIAFGLRKSKEDSTLSFLAQYTDMEDTTSINYKRLYLSVLISFAVGVIAGVIEGKIDVNDTSALIAIIGAGYAGTDAIEGFFSKNFNR